MPGLDMLMYKLTSDEGREAKEAMQVSALGDLNSISLEAIMQQIVPEFAWSEFHECSDSYFYQKIDEKGFCVM